MRRAATHVPEKWSPPLDRIGFARAGWGITEFGLPSTATLEVAVRQAAAPRRPPVKAGSRAARKVRTAQGTVLDNVQAEQPREGSGGRKAERLARGQADGKCNRKIPPEQ